MKHVLSMELDVITDLSPLELTSKVEQAVRKAVETVKAFLEVELTFDVSIVLDGRAVRFVMEPV